MALGTELRHLSYLGPWNTLYLMILALYILRHFNLFHPLPKFSMHLFRFAWSSEKLQLNENDFNYTSKCDDLHNLKNTPPRNAFSILKIKTENLLFKATWKQLPRIIITSTIFHQIVITQKFTLRLLTE